ncbi:MAG: HD-GYP domain-containing protein [Oscillospiraceae bacterium]|nr:HD-GYP domain-containing protein [Oscillospiraceae bacterium]
MKLRAKAPEPTYIYQKAFMGKNLTSVTLGFDVDSTNKIRTAGYLHDIGKIGIPENILNKKGKLDEQEMLVMKTHPERSWRVLQNSQEFSEISNIVLYHHEKWDGSGYPKGLKGEQIPINARIIKVADAYDAMTKDRSYRKKMSQTEAISELQNCSGTDFDPQIVEVFIGQVLSNENSFTIRT